MKGCSTSSTKKDPPFQVLIPALSFQRCPPTNVVSTVHQEIFKENSCQKTTAWLRNLPGLPKRPPTSGFPTPEPQLCDLAGTNKDTFLPLSFVREVLSVPALISRRTSSPPSPCCFALYCPPDLAFCAAPAAVPHPAPALKSFFFFLT